MVRFFVINALHNVVNVIHDVIDIGQNALKYSVNGIIKNTYNKINCGHFH